MMGTPIRWLLMMGVAACGYFAIMGKDINIRMMAFIGSAIIWQMHSVVLMWEADLFAAVKRKKLEREIQTLKESIERKETAEE